MSLEGLVGVKKKHVVKAFEMVDGSFITVNTLGPEELALEKVSAYMARRKVRDLYDVFFLIQLVREKRRVRTSVHPLKAHVSISSSQRCK